VVRIQTDWTRGPCEFSTGTVTFNPAPVVELCRRPGTARRGIMWCEVYACDECYARWLARPRRDGEESQ
jgi:hypothetical protein